MAARQLYHPYGTVRWSSGTLPTGFTFTGQRHDGYTQLIQMGARWYEARIGRWVSADTIVPSYLDPQSLNRFAYVYNRPLLYRDPTGHVGCLDAECRLIIHSATGAVVRRGTPIEELEGLVRFTAEDGLSWSSSDRYTILQGARMAGEAWGAVDGTPAGLAFRRAAGARVTFHRISGDPISGWAQTCQDYTARDDATGVAYCAQGNICYDSTVFGGARASFGQWGELNVLHELGHWFDQRGGRAARGDLSRQIIAWSDGHQWERVAGGGWKDGYKREPDGFAGGGWPWVQNPDPEPGEEYADMFLGWALSGFSDGPAGAARYRWMQVNMARWTALSVPASGASPR